MNQKQKKIFKKVNCSTHKKDFLFKISIFKSRAYFLSLNIDLSKFFLVFLYEIANNYANFVNKTGLLHWILHTVLEVTNI